MNNAAKRRALIVSALLATVFTIFSGRLIALQVSGHTDFVRGDAYKHINKQPLYAKRGTITDVNGEMLAQNEPTRRIIADGSLIRDRGVIADLLAKPLEMSREQLLEKLGRRKFSEAIGKEMPDRYIILKNDVPVLDAEAIAKSVEGGKHRGIFSEPDSIRRYPNGSLLCHITGYTNGENVGLEGIELTQNDYLRGNDGYRFVERAASGRELVLYRGQERAPRDGHNIKLTVDMGLQHIVETELDTAMKQFRPKKAVILMMRPQTGEILAVANRPNFDPNHYKDATDAERRNRAIADSFEPGSTFKIVTLAGALTERIVRPDTQIFCENGYYSRYKLEDSHRMGTLSVSDVLVKSSNIGACKLAVQLGEQKFYEYVKKFGFGDRTDIALNGEDNGILNPPYRWTKLSISRIPMGHEISATALQVVNAMSAIANGGELMLPQIVREVADAEGKVVFKMKPAAVRRVASAEAVHALNEAMKLVPTPKGTAPLAHVSGFKVAGKTGTAQVFEGKAYSHSRYRSSFCGYMPADAPEFTCLVFFDEPQMENQKAMGGLVCAPVFSRVAERAAGYLGLVPEPEPIPFQLAK